MYIVDVRVSVLVYYLPFVEFDVQYLCIFIEYLKLVKAVCVE